MKKRRKMNSVASVSVTTRVTAVMLAVVALVLEHIGLLVLANAAMRLHQVIEVERTSVFLVRLLRHDVDVESEHTHVFLVVFEHRHLRL